MLGKRGKRMAFLFAASKTEDVLPKSETAGFPASGRVQGACAMPEVIRVVKKGNVHCDSWQGTTRSSNKISPLHGPQRRLRFPVDKATAEISTVGRPVDCSCRTV